MHIAIAGILRHRIVRNQFAVRTTGMVCRISVPNRAEARRRHADSPDAMPACGNYASIFKRARTDGSFKLHDLASVSTSFRFFKTNILRSSIRQRIMGSAERINPLQNGFRTNAVSY